MIKSPEWQPTKVVDAKYLLQTLNLDNRNAVQGVSAPFLLQDSQMPLVQVL